MAEGSESSVPPTSSVLTAKDDTENPQIDTSNDTEEDSSLQDIVEVEFQPDCPVCLQPTFYPVKLPCGHIFCFLCIKGVALRSRKCAICRQVISTQYLDKPTLVKVLDKTQTPSSKSDLKGNCAQEESEYKWYYEGRNGWWQYDDKTSKEVEACFKSGKRSCTLLIAGFLYLIDFENMFQMRRNEPGRRRRIKRDKCDVDSKGIAGIRSRRSQNINNSSSTTPNINQSTSTSSQVDNDVQSSPLDGSPVESDSQGGSSSSPDSVSQDVSVDAVSDVIESTSLE